MRRTRSFAAGAPGVRAYGDQARCSPRGRLRCTLVGIVALSVLLYQVLERRGWRA